MKNTYFFHRRPPNLIQSYYDIKKQCRFQIRFSSFLLISFFILQYSVPISLVVLGSLTTSREQIALFLQRDTISSKDNQKVILDEGLAKKESENLLGKIIFILGVITILLGVINNTSRPSESYDTSANFNTKFNQFLRDLDLQVLHKGGFQDKSPDTYEFQKMCLFLIVKSDELTKLINEYNEARSLSPRQANIQALNNQEHQHELKNTNSAMFESINSAIPSNTPTNQSISNSHKT